MKCKKIYLCKVLRDSRRSSPKECARKCITMAIKASHIKGFVALSPILVFLGIYLVSSIIAGDFYRIPISSAFVIASAYAIAVTPGKISERMAIFSRGAGNGNVLLMIWIFILAGAFAATAREMGAVEATVSATLSIIPGNLLLAGLFLTACFISFAIGTSVGTIVALVPIAAGVATQTGVPMPQMAAVVVGGAFFGDNLSFISDTTIASTQAAGCDMRSKFKANITIVLPAVAVVLGIYLFRGIDGNVGAEAPGGVAIVKLIPYLLVIGLALAGVSVTLILFAGILSCAIVGFCTGALTWTSWLSSVGNGISGMGELIIITLLSGGMLALISHNGGLHYLIGGLTKRVGGVRAAQLSIAALVSLANVCTANNTIAIITTGEMAKRIGDKFGVAPRRIASLLDTFSCVIQGILPYGAQLLMAASLAGISSSSIIPFLYYPMALAVSALFAILVNPAKE